MSRRNTSIYPCWVLPCLQIHYDHQVLLDYLISKDTGASSAEYLLRYVPDSTFLFSSLVFGHGYKICKWITYAYHLWCFDRPNLHMVKHTSPKFATHLFLPIFKYDERKTIWYRIWFSLCKEFQLYRVAYSKITRALCKKHHLFYLAKVP